MSKDIRNLQNIMGMVFAQPWAIRGEKLGEMGHLLLQHVSGDQELQLGAYMDDDEDHDDDTYQLCGKVAVVSITGVIGKRLGWLEMACGGCDVDCVKRDVMRAMEDDRVEAIVLDIDSPGGMVTGTAELANFIAECSEVKPVMSYTELQMCSAAYWLGCAASEVFCSESSIVGSIGVVCSAVDHSARWKEQGYEALVFRSASLKAIGHTGEKWSKEWKEAMGDRVQGCAEKFYSHVRNNRGGDLEGECFSGDYWSGEKLLEFGLVDGFVDTLDDFVQIVNMRLETEFS